MLGLQEVFLCFRACVCIILNGVDLQKGKPFCVAACSSDMRPVPLQGDHAQYFRIAPLENYLFSPWFDVVGTLVNQESCVLILDSGLPCMSRKSHLSSDLVR